MTTPKNTREQSAGVDSADRLTLGDKTIMAPFGEILAEVKARRSEAEAPLEVEQFVIQSVFGGFFFRPNGKLNRDVNLAAVFNSWDDALALANFMPGSNRVMTRETFRRPMPE